MAQDKKKKKKTKTGKGRKHSAGDSRKALLTGLAAASAIGYMAGTPSGQELFAKLPRPAGVPPLLLLGGAGLLLKPKGLIKQVSLCAATIGAFQLGIRQSVPAPVPNGAEVDAGAHISQAHAALMDVDTAPDDGSAYSTDTVSGDDEIVELAEVDC